MVHTQGSAESRQQQDKDFGQEAVVETCSFAERLGLTL